MANASSQRQFLVTVNGIGGAFWATRTGGSKTVPVTREYDGGSDVPYLLTGPAEVGDLTLTRPFVVGRDDNVQANLLPQVGAWQTTIVQQPTDPSYKPQGGLTTWTGLLTGVTAPEENANAGAAGAVLTLTFACSAVQ